MVSMGRLSPHSPRLRMALGVPISKKFLAEFIGTFWLVLGGCGSAVLAAVFPYDSAAANPLGLGFLGVSLAFGLKIGRAHV